MSTPAVRFDAARFGWPEGRLILSGFNLEIAQGQITAIVGPSGCGKSTLLRLAAGLERPDAGQVTVPSPRRAFVFQSPTLLPWRTAAENVALPQILQGAPDPVAVARALERVGLGADADALPRQLSGGMKMRVSLARALVTAPDLMLMDEPFSALDALTRGRVHQEFLRLRRELGFTAVLITHDIDEAVFLADRVLTLAGPPLQVVADLAVALPRPREPGLRHDPALGARVAEVQRALGEL
ncbi:MAG: ABC transporter ATP-binding protein [Alphaproteobacteria bacterium]|nr:ABC transporter ATP-binding protein [Alphaproteobacteria bacterium]